MKIDFLKSALKESRINIDLHYFKEVDSTNKVATRMLVDGCEKVSLVVAERQTAGLGRRGNVWESDNSGGIWASLIFPNVLHTPNLYVRMISVAITHILGNYVKNVTIKWPNDILIGNKKVSGILAQNVDNKSGQGLVLGFGVDINQEIDVFPDSIKDIATSLFIETDKKYSKENILREILTDFFYLLKQSQKISFKEYLSLSSSIGRKCSVDGREVMTQSIASDGGLIIINESGVEEIVYSGTLRYLD